MSSPENKRLDSSATSHHIEAAKHHRVIDAVPIEQEAQQDVHHVKLGWRSWVVVFVACVAIFAQTFVVVAAGSVIAFIVRDLGNAPISGWIIQGPLLMQSVLSPVVGRLSDVLNRKYLASVPPLVAFVGAVISAKANSMSMLIGGGILIGTTLATVPIIHAILAEILPLKYRSLASGLAFMGGALGGIWLLTFSVPLSVGSLGSGAVTNISAGGWRYIFWMQAAFHGVTFLGLALLYWPAKNIEYPKMTIREYIWACDPIGSLLFVTSATLMLLALDWLGGAYAPSDPHVAAPLSIGLVCLVAFALYGWTFVTDMGHTEWKGRTDGLVAHVFFHKNANFALSVFAFSVEGWIFYSAVNSVVPQIVLNLGFADDSWRIAVRQLSYQLVTFAASIPIIWYSTRFKDMQTPLLVTFGIFFIVTICYATIRPTWSNAQLGLNVLAGIGQAGPLTLLVACVQFCAPHAFLSTATGLSFSARAIGGAFGSAVLNAIVNGQLSAHYASAVGAAATGAGLAAGRVPELLGYLEQGLSYLPDDKDGNAGNGGGITPAVWAAAVGASREEYARAYRLAWSSVIPFVVLAFVAVACLKGVKELMTEKVEATVEHAERVEKGPEGP
ncbi:hypothetical protein PG994_006827 [Apiospora phragmitis]|uniref:Major facilitator superfamily (MFS) profile domain-containing protein n=1 Tax=Apiospora phragmitis TaxID=2905665 RepID=A0ABR1VG65_9PEZI